MIDWLTLIQMHGYWLLFLLTVYEGTAIVYIGAFAASLGWLNIYAVLLVCILGNMTSDIVFFGIGRFGRRRVVERITNHFKINKKRMNRLKKALKEHFGKTLLVIKVVPPLPLPGLILTGASNVPTKTFLLYSLLITSIYTLIFTLLGFYSGIAFGAILKYINYGSLILTVLVVAVLITWYVSVIIARSIANKVEKV